VGLCYLCYGFGVDLLLVIVVWVVYCVWLLFGMLCLYSFVVSVVGLLMVNAAWWVIGLCGMDDS